MSDSGVVRRIGIGRFAGYDGGAEPACSDSMKLHCFGLYYLGGPVELLRLHEHLRRVYPDAALVSRREDMVLQVPIVGGIVPAGPGRPEVTYEVTNYQFDHGFGLTLLAFRSDQPIPDLMVAPARFIFQQAELGGAILAYLYQALGVDGMSEVPGVARRPICASDPE